MNNTVAWLLSGLWLIALTRFLKLGRKQHPLHPVRIVIYSWAIMFVLSATQIIQFSNVPVEPWLYLTGFASLLIVGASLGTGRSTLRSQSENNQSADTGTVGFMLAPEILSLAKVILILGGIGVLANLYVIFIGRPIDLTDIEKIRNPQLQDVLGTTTWADRVAYMTLPFTWMGFVLTILFSEKLKGRFRLLAVGFVIGLGIMGVMSLGRSIQLKIALFLYVATWVRRGMGLSAWPFKWTLSHRALLALVLVAAGWYFFVFVLSWRLGGMNNVVIDVTRFHKDASESVVMQQMPREMPGPVRGLITFTATYLTTEADNFASFYQDVNLDPYYGLWEFQSLASGLNKIGMPTKSIEQILREVQRDYDAVGLQIGQWRTMAQEFIVDFGRPGALFAIFLNGILIGYIYRKFKQGKPHFAMFMVFLIAWGAYGAWLSPFGYMEFLIGCLCTVYAVVGEVVQARRGVPARPHRVVRLPLKPVRP